MNVERLLTVLKDLLAASQSTQIEQRVARVTEASQAVVNNPADANARTQLSTQLAELRQATATDSINNYPTISREIIEEFSLENLIGVEVASRIEQAVQQNPATMDVALKAITELKEEISKDLAALRQIQQGLNRFGLEGETLKPQEATISFLVPRNENSVPVQTLIADLKDFEFISRSLERMVTDRQAPARVRALASSDFAITLDSPVEIALAAALATQWVIARYQEILNLRRSQIELKKLKSQAASDAIDQDVQHRITSIAQDVSQKLIKRFRAGKKTEPEINSNVEAAIKKIAAKIDQNYRIEIRVADEEKSEPEVTSDGQTTDADVRKEIRTIVAEIKFFKAADAPLLLLEASADDGE